MKIIQVNNYARIRGGSDRYFHNLSEILSRSHEVTMFAASPKDDDNDIPNNNLFWNNLPSELNIEGNVKLDALKYFWRSDVKDKFEECVEFVKPDLIHCHIYHGQLTPVIIQVAKSHNIPVVQTVHDFKLICGVDTLIKENNICVECKGSRFSRCAINKCNRGSLIRSVHTALECKFRSFLIPHSSISKYIFVSDFQQRLHLSNLPHLNSIVIPNFTPHVKISNKKQGEYLFYPTRLEDGKGLDRLFRLYSFAKKNNITLPKCIIAGGGGKELEYTESVSDLGIDDLISFVGRKTVNELSSYYNLCLAVLNFSSMNETFGLTVIEAFSHNKPCIVSNNGALPTLITKSFLGKILNFSETDEFLIGDLKNTITTLPSRSSEILTHFNENFSEEVHLNMIEKLYREIK